jgi:hypothetical protein
VASQQNILGPSGGATECVLCNIEEMADWQDAQTCPTKGLQGQLSLPWPQGADIPHCQPNTCHNDGHWQEVAFPQVSGMCDCAVQVHPLPANHSWRA